MHTIQGYEWGADKAAVNLRKHGVSFADAATVFVDESAKRISDEISSLDEDRFVILGVSVPGDVLVVVYTWRGDRIRIISARKATPRERKSYEGGQ
ncbi:MAG TPA: BrnT family toxin [Thermoanaerobaculia bacterium]|nr:BrnT family toxin [Thermoanaerobaculia bacterium]